MFGKVSKVCALKQWGGTKPSQALPKKEKVRNVAEVKCSSLRHQKPPANNRNMQIHVFSRWKKKDFIKSLQQSKEGEKNAACNQHDADDGEYAISIPI